MLRAGDLAVIEQIGEEFANEPIVFLLPERPNTTGS
jgi:hypothetical protein